MKNIVIGIIVIIVIILVIILVGNNKVEENKESVSEDQITVDHDGDDAMTEGVKEFSLDSFVEFVDEAPEPQFSVKEITVKKDDTIKIAVNVTSGIHSFKIDEFGVFANTPTGEITMVEFVADKAGEYIYYCNQPGHRELGHWGTITVIEN